MSGKNNSNNSNIEHHKGNPNQNGEIHEQQMFRVPNLPSGANLTRMIANGLNRTNNSTWRKCPEENTASRQDLFTVGRRNKIFLRHGSTFKMMFTNLSKQLQAELMQFLMAEMSRKPLKMLSSNKYSGLPHFKIILFNRLSRLGYERSICCRFLYNKKMQYSENIEIDRFYKFLMAGSYRNPVKNVRMIKGSDRF